MHFFHISLMLWATIVIADETSGASDSSSSSSSETPTLVWVTGTNSLGVLQTSQSAYTQKFASFYNILSSVPSGSINMGSISRTVGGMREYSRSTINGVEGTQTTNVVLKVFPFISALLGLLWL